MKIRKHILALGLALAIGATGTGVALAHGLPDTQPGQGMGPGMMGGAQDGMGPGMMGGAQGGMGMMQEMLDPEQREQLQQATPDSDIDPDDRDAYH